MIVGKFGIIDGAGADDGESALPDGTGIVQRVVGMPGKIHLLLRQ